MEEDVQIAAADDLPARQRADRIDVLLAGQEDGVPVRMPVNPRAGLHRCFREELIAGDGLARDGQPAGEHACRHEQRAQHHPAAQAGQPLHEDGAVVRRQDHGEHVPDVEQLVVVVLVGLKEDRLRDDEDRRHAQHDIQISPPPGLQHGQQHQDERQARVLDPEPEIPVDHAASAGVVHPVELEAQGAALHRLPDGAAQHLRQRERQHDPQVHARAGEDALCVLAVGDQPARHKAA